VIAALMATQVARANPVMVDGQSLFAFGIIVFWALTIESGLATLSLVSCGVLIVPLFGTLLIANVGIFLVVFLPLTTREPLWLLEAGVVVADAVAIKLLAASPFLQGPGFWGVSWRRALLASFLGNAASYFIGVIASHEPWLVHGAGGAE
jgi:hypothetical protein